MLIGKAAFVLAALVPFLGVSGAQQPDSATLRKQYLEKFPWTISNTTAGDAMMLRIMVESMGAKRGVEVGTNTGYGAINMGIGFERTGGPAYDDRNQCPNGGSGAAASSKDRIGEGCDGH